MSVAAVGALAAISLAVLMFSLQAPARPASQESTGGHRLYGTITLAPALQADLDGSEVLYVIVRSGAGPPLAVRRIPAPRFPTEYEIDQGDVMTPEERLEDQVALSARLTRSGQAGPAQTGDVEGEHAGPVRVGDRVDIVLDRRH
ncbi:MAG TPA: hypothetical protein VMG58_08590 [Candidatus Sulfotelmatobacter sp.]|nr:hypothetical protein [Candidatus Sulfotelmatobacter sp.]